jgi:hypothetical protein
MNVEGLSGLVNRVIAWADRLQREHGVLGFPYAVIKKYGDDAGGRHAALITYYGFLSIFPLLLLGVAILTRVLADHADLRRRRWPGRPWSSRGAAPGRQVAAGAARACRVLWPGAVLSAAAVTVVLNLGAPLLARLVTKAGPVYGSFATVAGMFALLYLIGRALVYAAEVAAVRYARVWPRALDLTRLTEADTRALTLLAREQERIPAARVEFHLAAPGSPPGPGGTPSAGGGPG